MVELRAGQSQDAAAITPLILRSAPQLLPYIFGSSKHALIYLAKATAQYDGQYSALRHTIALVGGDLIGCMSLWHDKMPEGFYQSTINSLTSFLSIQQLQHIMKINDTLAALFLAPKSNELCIGHLAVDEAWQGQKVASSLMAYALQQAKLLGKQKVVLDVDTGNHRAIAFYAYCGFKQQSQKVFIPTQQTFVRMHRSLA